MDGQLFPLRDDLSILAAKARRDSPQGPWGHVLAPYKHHPFMQPGTLVLSFAENPCRALLRRQRGACLTALRLIAVDRQQQIAADQVRNMGRRLHRYDEELMVLQQAATELLTNQKAMYDALKDNLHFFHEKVKRLEERFPDDLPDLDTEDPWFQAEDPAEDQAIAMEEVNEHPQPTEAPTAGAHSKSVSGGPQGATAPQLPEAAGANAPQLPAAAQALMDNLHAFLAGHTP